MKEAPESTGLLRAEDAEAIRDAVGEIRRINGHLAGLRNTVDQIERDMQFYLIRQNERIDQGLSFLLWINGFCFVGIMLAFCVLYFR